MSRRELLNIHFLRHCLIFLPSYQLAAVNPQIDAGCTNLMPDEVLCLGTQGEDCTTTYVVQPDDTCDQISQNHGLNNTILYENNPQINQDCTNIYIGEVRSTCVNRASYEKSHSS